MTLNRRDFLSIAGRAFGVAGADVALRKLQRYGIDVGSDAGSGSGDYLGSVLEKGSGQAYGFFEYKGPKKAIEDRVPRVRKAYGVPEEVDLCLWDCADLPEDYRNLMVDMDTVQKPGAGLRYMLEAKFPGTGNREAADEVASVLNGLYQTDLFTEGEPFSGRILYKENGSFVDRE